MARRPDNPLYRAPAGLVVGVGVALVIALAVVVGVVGCEGDDEESSATVSEAAPATTGAVAGMERCLVQNPARPVRAAFQGPEAYVACAQFAIQAPHYGGAGWTIARDAPAPPLTGGLHVVCELNAANASHATILDTGSAREGLAQCHRMQRDGWEPGPRP